MIDELPRHRLECVGEDPNLSGRPYLVDLHFPVTVRDRARGGREALNRPRHPRRDHKRQYEAERDGHGAEPDTAPPDAAYQRCELPAGTADQQDTEHGAAPSREWKRI